MKYLLAAVILLSGCPKPPVRAPIAVHVTPEHIEVTTGGQRQTFTATVDNDTANKGVTWLLVDENGPCSPRCGALEIAPDGKSVQYTPPQLWPIE